VLRVIFALSPALFLRYFALFLRHPVRFHDALDRASATRAPALATTFEVRRRRAVLLRVLHSEPTFDIDEREHVLSRQLGFRQKSFRI
jgi:hypothetical protein